MDYFFLFTKHLDEKSCFCLKLSQNAELLLPPAQRDFSEIRSLQEQCSTIVVETTSNASILQLELPWLPERKARMAIPYALEDKLAQPLDELHFAFDKQRYQNNHYIIAVIAKEKIQQLMLQLSDKQIQFDQISLDWFALGVNESCISEAILLLNTPDFKGALTGELASTYLKKNPFSETLIFEDSELPFESPIPKRQEHSYTWIAQQLLKLRPLNLCQGEIQHGNTYDWIKKGYQLAGILCSVWLLSILLVNAVSLFSLNKKNKQIDQQIAMIYHEFFPEAKQVISPKFRISQLLSSNTNDTQARFWFLLNQFAKVMTDADLTLEQLRFQNKTLSVTLRGSDFAKLEAIENKLKQAKLNVKQTQASTRDQYVVATLELM